MKKKSILRWALPATLALAGTSAYSAPIGIVDSGTDLKHAWLRAKIWTNSKDSSEDSNDNDNNGFVDDIHGWNFAENNNEIIDYSYLGKFSADVRKFFDIQLKVVDGSATDADKKWVEEKRKDKDFLQELMKFGNFVHGTHVAGIAARDADQARIMAAKIIPTEVKGPGVGLASEILDRLTHQFSLQFFKPFEGFFDDMLMNGALSFLAGQQTQALETVGKYLNQTQMKVANCSFGTSMVQAKMVVGMIGKALLKKDLSEEELKKYSAVFMQQVLEKGSVFIKSAPQTFFVMAAGNDGTNNDEMAVFPANLKMDNTISVAASRGYDRLANFSNYGAKMVEIAAPGVGIQSSIPGEEVMPLSGTSQAAPFITNIVGRLKDANPSLNFAQIKKILMETVDKKDFLVGKVASGGIANSERALRAAYLTLDGESVEGAVEKSILEVSDLSSEQSVMGAEGWSAGDSGEDGTPVSLPTLF